VYDLQFKLASEKANDQATLAEANAKLELRLLEIGKQAKTIKAQDLSIRQLQHKSEVLEKTLNMIKSDFVALENTSASQNAEFSAQIATQEKSIAMYEALERDIVSQQLDQARSMLGTKGAETMVNGFNSIPIVEYIVNNLQRSIASPSERSSKPQSRSFMDSMLFAQRFVTMERLLESTQAGYSAKCAELSSMKNKLEKAEKRAAILTQPQAYFIERLEQNEKELDAYQKNVLELETEVNQLKKRLASSIEVRNDLRSDLQDVLSTRESLERDLISRLDQGNKYIPSFTKQKDRWSQTK
jgi:hypothetical protein